MPSISEHLARVFAPKIAHEKNAAKRYDGFIRDMAAGVMPDADFLEKVCAELDKSAADVEADVARIVARTEAAGTLAKAEESHESADEARVELQKLKDEDARRQANFDDACWPLIQTINKANEVEKLTYNARATLLSTASPEADRKSQVATAAAEKANMVASRIREQIQDAERNASNAEDRALHANIPPVIEESTALAASYRSQAAALAKHLAVAEAQAAAAGAKAVAAREELLIP